MQLARVHQYVKNAFVCLPIFFGYKLTDVQALQQTGLAFLVFCLAASSVYVVNDLCDLEEDRRHPLKRLPPPGCRGVASRPGGRLFSPLIGHAPLFWRSFSCHQSFW